jgi:zinc transporter
MTDQIGDVIVDLDDLTDEMEESVESPDPAELQTTISNIRRSAIHLRRYIAPQRDSLVKLAMDKTDWIDETDRFHIREMAERTYRYVQDIESVRDRAIICQEEIKNRISGQMNKAIYILSIVTAIFLPLGLLTGLLGINVGGLPGAEKKWAFWIVTLILGALAGIIITWFKKIKWL